jgi:hypothetical protein
MTEEVHKYMIAQYIKWFNVSLIMYWSLSHCYWDIIHTHTLTASNYDASTEKIPQFTGPSIYVNK